MNPDSPPDRDWVLGILAQLGNCAPQAVGERIDSLELTWLVAQAEQEYGVVLELDDEQLARMSTVTGAVDALGDVLARALP